MSVSETVPPWVTVGGWAYSGGIYAVIRSLIHARANEVQVQNWVPYAPYFLDHGNRRGSFVYSMKVSEFIQDYVPCEPPPNNGYPAWLRVGQWVYMVDQQRYGVITQLHPPELGPGITPYVHVRNHRPHADDLHFEVDSIYGEGFLRHWVPCDRPEDPRPSWCRLANEFF